MYSSLSRKTVMEEVNNIIQEGINMRRWKKEEMVENLQYIWENTYNIIRNKIVEIEDAFEIRPNVSPIFAELMMKRY